MSDPARPAPEGIRPEVWKGYLEAPAHCVAEILGGEPYVMPRPRPLHASVTGRLRGRLRGFDDPDVGEPGGWVILVEPELQLSAVDRPVTLALSSG